MGSKFFTANNPIARLNRFLKDARLQRAALSKALKKRQQFNLLNSKDSFNFSSKKKNEFLYFL